MGSSEICSCSLMTPRDESMSVSVGYPVSSINVMLNISTSSQSHIISFQKITKSYTPDEKGTCSLKKGSSPDKSDIPPKFRIMGKRLPVYPPEMSAQKQTTSTCPTSSKRGTWRSTRSSPCTSLFQWYFQ